MVVGCIVEGMGELLIKEHEVVVSILAETQSAEEVDELLQPVPAERRALIVGWVDEVRSLLEGEAARLRAERPTPNLRAARRRRLRR